jgi:PEP-CTERM motif
MRPVDKVSVVFTTSAVIFSQQLDSPRAEEMAQKLHINGYGRGRSAVVNECCGSRPISLGLHKGVLQVIKTLAIAAAAAALATTPAAAATMNGTLAVSMFDLASSTPSIDVGSTITNSAALVSGTTADFDPTPGLTSLLVSPFIFANGNSIFFSSAIGDFSGTFNTVDADGLPANRVLSGYALGTFTPSGIFGSFDGGAASLTLSFTQNGENGAISGGFTLSTPPSPPPPSVPEPASWAMLIAGFGLTGAAMRRRRSAVAA